MVPDTAVAAPHDTATHDTATAPVTADREPVDVAMVDDLIEDVSIDGMCGVY